MDQAIQAKKTEPEQMPDEPKPQTNENYDNESMVNKPLTEQEQALVRNMNFVMESLENDHPVDITNIDLSEIDDFIDNRTRGLKR
jgi:hypothetical protein